MATATQERVTTKKEKKEEASEYKFVISYNSTDSYLADHEINAKELGEAILGMHNLIEESAKIISSGSADVELKVTTPVQEGSVEVVFALLAQPEVALKILAVIGFAAQGRAIGKAAMIELVKKIGSKKITSITIDGDSDDAKIHIEGGDTIIADKSVARLVANKRAREGLHKVIQAPLIGKPDATFKVLDEHQEPLAYVDTADIIEYKPLPAGTLEEVSVERQKLNVSFSQINFDSTKGWRIKNKDSEEFPVTMKDQEFLNKVKENKQEFRKDDLYEIDLETTTTSRPTRSTIERVVIEVTRHWASGDRRQV